MNIWCKQNYGFCFLLTFITICYLIIPSISQIEGLETIKCKTCKEQCKAKKGEKTKKGRAAQAHYAACFKDQCANLCKKKVKMAKKGDKQDKKEQKKGAKAKRNEEIRKLSDRALKIKKRMEQFNEQSKSLRNKYKNVSFEATKLLIPKVKKKESFRTLGGDNVGGEPFYGALNY